MTNDRFRPTVHPVAGALGLGPHLDGRLVQLPARAHDGPAIDHGDRLDLESNSLCAALEWDHVPRPHDLRPIQERPPLEFRGLDLEALATELRLHLAAQPYRHDHGRGRARNHGRSPDDISDRRNDFDLVRDTY